MRTIVAADHTRRTQQGMPRSQTSTSSGLNSVASGDLGEVQRREARYARMVAHSPYHPNALSVNRFVETFSSSVHDVSEADLLITAQ